MTGSRRTRTLAALVWLLSSAAATITAADRAVPVAEYIARLDALTSVLSAGPAADARAEVVFEGLPDTLRVDASPRAFDINFEPLRRDFKASIKQHDTVLREGVLNTLRTMRSEAAGFEGPADDRSATRAVLAEILARREFQDLRGPTWIDRLRQAVLRLLADLFGMVASQSAIPTIGRGIVYALVAAAALVLLFRLFCAARSRADDPMFRLPATSSIAGWSEWLSAAQQAAAAGRWRDAIHLTYWSGVAFLEGRGAWQPDRARTPREYLRLLPEASADRVALAALTRRFELVWYGNAGADARAYADAIADLKQLGCPAP